MGRSLAAVVIVALGMSAVLGGPGAGAGAATGRDVEEPEAETFLMLAADEMKAFHAQYKSYARDWYRLGFDYAYPTYRITDPDIWPRRADKNRWRPRGSHYTYVIAEAGPDAFLIRAIGNDDDEVAYELRQGMKAPRKVE